MVYAFVFLMGLITGGVCVFLGLAEKRRKLKAKGEKLAVQLKSVPTVLQTLKNRREEIEQQAHKNEEILKAKEILSIVVDDGSVAFTRRSP
jgi:hypothetical protein